MNILIVDDDALHGRSVRDLLAAHNYPADVVTSGQEGLRTLTDAAAAHTPYHVLVLDLHIPDLMGVELLREVRERGINTKTIILSGESELDTVTPILKLGAIDYLRKPFDPEQLINSVRNAVSNYALERENETFQAEAQANAKLYEFLLNAAPDLVYMLDPEGRLQFANERLKNIFSYEVDEIIGQPWTALFDSLPSLKAELEYHVNERRTGARATIATEFEFESDIGSRHALELSAIGLYENQAEEQRFLGTYGVIRDVTETVRARRDLVQSQRKFYSLFVNSPDAVFIARRSDGAIIERNPKFLALREIFHAEDDGTDQFIWQDEQQRQDFLTALDSNPEQLNWTFIANDDQFFEILARYIDIEDETHIIATLRDRSAERRAEQDRLAIQRQLQQAGRMEAIGQVAGGIAHDFNNILASIIGYAELVMNARSRLQAEQVDQYLEEVVIAGHRAKDLISQMLNFTRAKRAEEIGAIDITETISDVSRMLRAAIPSTIELHSDYHADLAAVKIDPVQLQQIVINLLINARDAITGNGRIDVNVSNTKVSKTCSVCGEPISPAGEEQVRIGVRDTGHGIGNELQAQIFDMYFTTRTPGTGTGLGLWMVNNLVHEHLGHIVLESEPGRGTEFSIYLPAQTDAKPVDMTFNVPKPRLDGRIVVVDDEASVANFVAEVLRDQGYPTVVFTDSGHAMEYLKDNLGQISLLLTDGQMPFISGVELATYAKANSPDLPIMFITAHSQAYDQSALKRIGVKHYLQKPFSIDDMVSAVSSLTGAGVN